MDAEPRYTGAAPTRRRTTATPTTYTATVHAGGRRLHVGTSHPTAVAAAAARDGALVALVGGVAAVAAGLNCPPTDAAAAAALAAARPLTGEALQRRLTELAGAAARRGRPPAPRCGVCAACRARAAGVGRRRRCERAAEAEPEQERPRRRQRAERAAVAPPPPRPARPPPPLTPPPPLRVTATPPPAEADLHARHLKTLPVPPPPPGTLEQWAGYDYGGWINAAAARGGARVPRARARERGACRLCGGDSHEAAGCPLVTVYGRVSAGEEADRGTTPLRSAVSALTSALAAAGAAGAGAPPPELTDAGQGAVAALAEAVAGG